MAMYYGFRILARVRSELLAILEERLIAQEYHPDKGSVEYLFDRCYGSSSSFTFEVDNRDNALSPGPVSWSTELQHPMTSDSKFNPDTGELDMFFSTSRQAADEWAFSLLPYLILHENGAVIPFMLVQYEENSYGMGDDMDDGRMSLYVARMSSDGPACLSTVVRGNLSRMGFNDKRVTDRVAALDADVKSGRVVSAE